MLRVTRALAAAGGALVLAISPVAPDDASAPAPTEDPGWSGDDPGWAG